MNRLRESVRPLVTFAFVLAQIALALLWVAMGDESAKEPSTFLAPFTMLIIRDYFVGREKNEAA